MQTQRSRRFYRQARSLFPGGVSSPVRAFAPYPRFLHRGRGAYVYDVDGNRYIDWCMAFGPLILGHAHPYVVEQIRRQLGAGWNFGAPTEAEIRLGEKVRGHFPSVEMLRFVNSGTEATMHAIRLARGATGRRKIVKATGAYHGAHDAVLVRAGSGATTFGVPSSAGVLGDTAKHTLTVPFNDADAMRKVVTASRRDLAAVILEPMLGNAGPIPPEDGYLQEVREVTEANDVLLIFDEVITGFRLAMGGAQERYGVRADLTTLGKILGGGVPIGAFGGPAELMEYLAPLGNVYQAGTASGNPLAMTAGLATLDVLKRTGLRGVNRLGDRMRKGLADAAAEFGFRAQGLASMFQLFLTAKPVRSYEDALACDAKAFHRLFLALLDEGVYLPPSQFETCFLSTAHTGKDVDATLEAFAKCLADV
ncbi:MAG TPA: glutamate-1-semialdehyde 2,1-aminomutase [Thermoplasmata archaeon]|nr:glutamate-1-semialdehyde 2,1-aminomutase [Thermoplasmata archaeon]